MTENEKSPSEPHKGWLAGIPSIASVLVIVGALSLLALKVSDSIEERQHDAEDAVAEIFDHLQRQTFVYARMVADNSQIRRGVHFNNTAMILKYIQPVQKQIKVDTITVHNSASIILAQSHDPTRFNIADSQNSDIRKSFKGISHSTIDFSSRPLSVKTSIPVYHENDDSLIVGAVTVGYSINPNFAGDIRKISGINVLFVLNQEVVTTSFPKFKITSLQSNQTTLDYFNTSYDITAIPIKNNSHKELSLIVAVNNFASRVTLWMILLSIPLVVAFVYRERNQAMEREKGRNQALALETQRRAAIQLQAEVDERKKAQAELEIALDLAQTANRLKDEFLANVSHELRTPLNSLVNVPPTLLADFQGQEVLYCTQCNEGFMPEGPAIPEPCPDCGVLLTVQEQLAFGGDPATHSHYLQLADRNSQKLLHVVESLLYSSEIEAGRVVLDTNETDVESLLSQIVEETNALAQTKSIDLHHELAITEPNVELDSEKVMRVLTILVDNAIKFSDAGSAVHLKVQQLTNGASQSKGVEFSVADTGQGIPKEEIPTLFDKFRQVDGSHTREAQGLGLGLSIAKGLVDIHGGTFRVESEMGKGSTFTFQVPTGSSSDEGATS